jgi:hypothetical protein
LEAIDETDSGPALRRAEFEIDFAEREPVEARISFEARNTWRSELARSRPGCSRRHDPSSARKNIDIPLTDGARLWEDAQNPG